MFALVDCNNFYVSCERAFNPQLQDKAIVVLSNNDGCVVARSPEVKALGIGMGVPLFKIREEVKKYNILTFSSNYALYGDLSNRVMKILGSFTPEVEIYSIDEAFLGLSGFKDIDLTTYTMEIRQTIMQWTGIPVSIGIASTKTLAKIANRVAKKSPSGLFDLSICPDQDSVLQKIDISDVWGIGRKLSNWMKEQNIHNALQLRDTDIPIIRKKMGVVGERLVRELRGESCLPLEICPSPKKETCVSRSFGKVVTDLTELKEAVAHFTTKASAKLRKQQQCASALTVFIRTSRYASSPWGDTVTLALPVATNDTPELIYYAMRLTNRLFLPDVPYKKAGVIMQGLIPQSTVQSSLFDTKDRYKSLRLMEVVDQINDRFGEGTIKFAVEGIKQEWKMKNENRSPSYTTRADQLPVAWCH